MTQKFNVSMSPQLYDRLEAVCEEMGVTRSAYISFAVNAYLNSQSLTSQLPELLQSMKRLEALAASGELSDK